MRINVAFVGELGADSVKPFQHASMGAEHSAYLVANDSQVPGFNFAVGGTPAAAFEAEKNSGPALSGHHAGLFKIDPKTTIITGAAAMTVAVKELLGK